MRTLAALLLAFSAQAYACPNLTGTYTCTYQDGSTEVVSISQEQKNGVTVYNYNGSPMPADNKAYPMPDDQTLRESTFRAWCEGEVLKGNLIGKYYNEGSYFGDLNLLLDITKQGTDLKQVSAGSLKNSGGEYPIEGEIVCTIN